ncbi:MAG: flagellar filament capping protein FliD [Sulfurospirillaceae bacterium]|nr:flagellar filament capping protein FliD [Sulfurospirillaceae bacterium]
MATSAISSLGIGSNGVLSQSVIDQLKAAETSSIITPIDNKITQNTTKTKDLTALTTLVATLKADTSTLSSELTYLNNTVTSSSSNVSVTASSGVPAQDFSLNVTQLAKQDIYQSNSYANTTSTFTGGPDTININIGGNNYGIPVTSTTTLADLQSQIYGATNGKVTASLLNVGGTTPYKLTLKSTDTGTSNAITVTSTGGGTAVTDLGLNAVGNHIQTAADAQFTYNNINITRPTNTVSDLIVGVNININSTGASNISIKQDTSSISNAVSSFVKDYNSLMDSLNSSTSYDSSTKTAGIFQGTSEVRDLKSAINNQLLSIDSKGRSLSDYGVSLNSAGLLQLDQTTLDSKLSTNPADVQDFFRGSTTTTGTTTTTTNGYFTNYNSLLSSYIDSSTGVLTQLNTQFTTQATSLADEKQKATASLDAKYATLTSKFISYDSMISNFNSSFQSLSMQIQSLTSNNSTKG